MTTRTTTTVDIHLHGDIMLHVEDGRIIGTSVIDEDGEKHFVPVDDTDTPDHPANGYVAVFVGRGYPAYKYTTPVAAGQAQHKKHDTRNITRDLAICRAATPGPWTSLVGNRPPIETLKECTFYNSVIACGPHGLSQEVAGPPSEQSPCKNWHNNAQFIAAARTMTEYYICWAMELDGSLGAIDAALGLGPDATLDDMIQYIKELKKQSGKR